MPAQTSRFNLVSTTSLSRSLLSPCNPWRVASRMRLIAGYEGEVGS
jgi:hypothetical protein